MRAVRCGLRVHAHPVAFSRKFGTASRRRCAHSGLSARMALSNDSLRAALNPAQRRTSAQHCSPGPTPTSRKTERPAIHRGRLEMIIGPMFSGKTTELMQRIEVEEAAGRNVLAVKSEIDTRYATTSRHRSCIVSHSGGKRECVAVAKLSMLKQLFMEDYQKADVVAIDEAQFFPDLAMFCKQAADHDAKVVYVAGLDGDFRRRPFKLDNQKSSAILSLIPLADKVSKLLARCWYCDEAAPFTLRTLLDEREVLVGGADSYVPVCREHYIAKWTELHSEESAESTPTK